jgi:isoquinoline 1-oxidoreductase beta subunit
VFCATVVRSTTVLRSPSQVSAVALEEGVAAVAETFPDAQRGLQALKVEWNDQGGKAQ